VAAPTIDELTVADSPDAWRRVGFDVEDDLFRVGSVQVRLGGPEAGRGIVACSLRALASDAPDGLAMHRSEAPLRESRVAPHPNGTVALDHLVAFSPSLERTVPELERAGLELRRLREEPTPAGAPRQAFFRLAEVILEVIERPPGSREERSSDTPARFWGLAFSVSDLDACVSHLGALAGEPRDAVQPGRRIATLRREAGVGVAVAFMTRSPGAA
jgi:hypothetical protein